MASTYPADVAEAAKWSKANPNQKGDAAVKAVASQPWDPSVQSLVAFPQVLQMMGDKPDWVQNLGDAFLASSKDVLDSAQRLRGAGAEDGNLKSHRAAEGRGRAGAAGGHADDDQDRAGEPEVVYVPAYNPTVVYGAWPYPAYPPLYYPPPPAYYPGAALATGIMFGVGVRRRLPSGATATGAAGTSTSTSTEVQQRERQPATQRQPDELPAQRGQPPRRALPRRASQQKFGKNVAGANQREDFRGPRTGLATRSASRRKPAPAARHGSGPGARTAAQRSRHA